uniref:Uncharacterized protein n=1 Tax=Glossina austeni TaxID=7395 RepID=A0A1A9VD44_GLOAU
MLDAKPGDVNYLYSFGNDYRYLPNDNEQHAEESTLEVKCQQYINANTLIHAKCSGLCPRVVGVAMNVSSALLRKAYNLLSCDGEFEFHAGLTLSSCLPVSPPLELSTSQKKAKTKDLSPWINIKQAKRGIAEKPNSLANY